MDRQFVKIEKGLGPQGRIAVVRFDRGDNINALSQQAMRELRDVPRDGAADSWFAYGYRDGTSAARMRRRISNPSQPGRLTSSTTRSYPRDNAFSKASGPFSAESTMCPDRVSARAICLAN